MGVVKIETAGQSQSETCNCCGGETRCVWGYAYEDRNCVAAYFVRWTAGRVLDHGANFDLIIGDWGEGVPAGCRSAVALEYRITEKGPAFMLIDAGGRRLSTMELVGNVLSREEALKSPLRSKAFSIVDAILAEDARVREILRR